MAADDVAAAVGRVAVGAPVNGIVEVGGPEQFRSTSASGECLAAMNDPREVVADPSARYFGIAVSERHSCPGMGRWSGEIRLDDWLREATARSGHRDGRLIEVDVQPIKEKERQR